MALLPQNVDYTDKDFDSLRTRIFALIRTVFPEWTDDSVANFGNILVESFAFIGDVLCFYQDAQARESRITTAVLRRSLLALCKLVGYRPVGASAASVDVTLTLASPAATSVTIARGSTAQTDEVADPILYQFLEAVVFAPGELVKTVTVEHSSFASLTVEATGLPNQRIVLPETPYLDGSAKVAFANGAYTEVANLLSSKATDRHFVVVVDQNDRATLRFGNGVNGALPQGTGDLEYKVGGGSGGRVDAGKLRRLTSAVYDAVGNPVRISVTNVSRSSGGDDRESNALIRVNAPASLRVLRRAVAREDYEIAARQVPGVARALHITSNEFAGTGENAGVLFVVPTGGGAPTGALLAAVAAQFAPSGPYPKVNTYHLTVQAAPYRVVPVQAVIYRRAGATAAATKAAVIAALEGFFALENADGTANPGINFGFYYQDADGHPVGELAWSDVFNVIRDVPAVRKVDEGPTGLLLEGKRASVALGLWDFPALGAVTLIDGATGNTL